MSVHRVGEDSYSSREIMLKVELAMLKEGI